jgi:hypothetical protein
VLREDEEKHGMIDQKEVMQTIEHLQKTFDNLVIRGVRTIGPQQLSTLEALREELVRIGAAHLAERIQAVITAIKNGGSNGSHALMSAQASLRVFERLITIDVAKEELQEIVRFPSRAEDAAS